MQVSAPVFCLHLAYFGLMLDLVLSSINSINAQSELSCFMPCSSFCTRHGSLVSLFPGPEQGELHDVFVLGGMVKKAEVAALSSGEPYVSPVSSWVPSTPLLGVENSEKHFWACSHTLLQILFQQGMPCYV